MKRAKAIKEYRFTRKRVEEITGITSRNVYYYTHEGVIEPIDKENTTSGRDNQYYYRNLVEFMLVSKLQNLGLTLGQIKYILITMRNNKFTLTWKSNKAIDNMKRRLIILDGHTENPRILYQYAAQIPTLDFWSEEISDMLIVNMKSIFKTIREKITDKDKVDISKSKNSKQKKKTVKLKVPTKLKKKTSQ